MTSCETVVKADEPEDDDDFEDNPYGLKDDAQKWLEEDMEPFREEDKTHHKSCYRPYLIDSNLPIEDDELTQEAQEHLEKAVTEYWDRVEEADSETIKKPIQPVLVLLGLSKQKMEILIENEALGSGRFLYFPTLYWKGNEEGSLFLTYMPGPEHGCTDSAFSGEANTWSAKYDMDRILAMGLSCGGKNYTQPDFRIFPRVEYRDSTTRDKDEGNKMNPHTRMFWECEFSNRNIIELCQHGKKLMDNTHFTRLFAGCKFTSPTRADPGFEAGLVLWGKNEDTNVVEVLQAIDFGSRELDAKWKQLWSEPRADMLPPVHNWDRPGNAGACPWRPPNSLRNPGPEWVLRIPIKSLLYKVKNYGTNQYLVPQLIQRGNNYLFEGEEITDLCINIKKVALNMATSTGERHSM